MTARKPAFAAAGKAIFDEVTLEFELDAHEHRLLVELCRTADDLDRLHRIVKKEGDMVDGTGGRRVVHPAAVEARQLRIAFARLVAALRLPDGEAGDESAGRRPARRLGARGVYGLAAVR